MDVPRIVAMLKEYAKVLIDIIAPPNCHICSALLRDNAGCDAAICHDCRDGLRRTRILTCEICGEELKTAAGLKTLRCHICRRKVSPYRRVKTCYIYEAGTRELIHKFKYGNRPYLAKTIASLVKDALAQDGERSFEAADFLLPVPLHPGREREREFNQARLLAQELGALWKIPTASFLLRTKNTHPQADLKPGERETNLAGAFALAAGAPDPRGKKITIIDDIVTTGATVREAARVLAEAGAADISVLAFAKG